MSPPDLKSDTSLPNPQKGLECPPSSPPEIDVVIPTFNCRSNIDRCLRDLRAQQGVRLRVIIVDSGSTDGTIEIARQHGAEIVVNPGQLAAGLKGARHTGELLSRAEFVWIVDSDNFVHDDQAAYKLVIPLLSDSTIQLSIPMICAQEGTSWFNRWLTLHERNALLEMSQRGTRLCDHVWKLDEIDYGISNATLIRRAALIAAGGYDSDVRLLQRLRRQNLAKGVVVTTAEYTHEQTTGALDYQRKWKKKVVRYSRLGREELKAYFVQDAGDNRASKSHRGMFNSMMSNPVEYAKLSLRRLYETRDSAYLGFIVYFLIVAYIALTHPRALRRAYSVFVQDEGT